MAGADISAKSEEVPWSNSYVYTRSDSVSFSAKKKKKPMFNNCHCSGVFFFNFFMWVLHLDFKRISALLPYMVKF